MTELDKYAIDERFNKLEGNLVDILDHLKIVLEDIDNRLKELEAYGRTEVYRGS